MVALQKHLLPQRKCLFNCTVVKVKAKTIRPLLLAIIALLICKTSFSEPIECPRELEGITQTLPPPREWNVIYIKDPKNQLSDALIYEGPPEEIHSEIYDDYVEKKNADNSEEAVATWKIAEVKNPWIECRYSNTNISLTKKLDNLTTKKCQKILKRINKHQAWRISKFDCQ